MLRGRRRLGGRLRLRVVQWLGHASLTGDRAPEGLEGRLEAGDRASCCSGTAGSGNRTPQACSCGANGTSTGSTGSTGDTGDTTGTNGGWLARPNA